MEHARLYLFIAVFLLMFALPESLLAQETLKLPTKSKTAKPSSKNTTTSKKKTTPSDSSVTIEKSNSDQNSQTNKEQTSNENAPKDSNTQKENEERTNLEAQNLYWKSVENSNNPVLYKNYLEKFPNGFYADIARAKVQELEEAQRKAEELKRNEASKPDDKNAKDDSKGAKSKSEEKKKSDKSTKTDVSKQEDNKIPENVAKAEKPEVESNNANKALVNADQSLSPKVGSSKPYTAGILNESAISLPGAKYPEGARRSKVQGMVTVAVIVDETGKVISAKALRGPASLQQAAVEAAYLAKFPQTIILGRPTQVEGVINYDFKLENPVKKP
jgi:TonB family protein